MENKTVKDIVSYWPSISAFAEAVSTPDDIVPMSRVYRWMERNKIIRKYHQRILDAAKVRGVILTEQEIKALSPKGKLRGMHVAKNG